MGPMDGHMGWMWLWWLFGLGVLVLVVWAIARGELDEQEYERRLANLRK
jgi:hypothetical protein